MHGNDRIGSDALQFRHGLRDQLVWRGRQVEPAGYRVHFLDPRNLLRAADRIDQSDMAA